MRKLLFLIFVFILTKTSSAQITLEHTYDSASIVGPNSFSGLFYMVDLEVDSFKYMRTYWVYGTSERQLRFYNLDHSIWKTIDISSFPTPPPLSLNYGFSILYVSQHLFNSDDSLEFMYACTDCSPNFTAIYNEAGRQLFFGDSLEPVVDLHVPQAMRPIYSTQQGTKMILSHMNGTVNVYSLNGILTTGIDMYAPKGGPEFKIAPTPTSEFTRINFSLPQGINNAQIIVCDINGNKLKEYNVDSSFNDLVINNKDFPPGTYLFTLQSQNDIITRKQIVIH